MLSRAATSLTLLGRHLERADHLARILGVHVALALDRTDEPGPEFWLRFMDLAGWRNAETGSRDHAVEVVVTGSLGPSVRASVAAARSAAQAVRPSLPTELYEQVNALHWRAQEEAWQRDLYRFLMDVQMSIRLVDGLVEDTMFHDEARDFVRLGKFVERAANVTTTVTRKSAELGETVMEVRLRPMDGNGQRCTDFRLELSHGVKPRGYMDGYGNNVHYFNLVRPHSGLSVISRSTVE